MSPVLKMFMFYNWIEDSNDNIELAKQHGYLVGSFINPEAVRKLTKTDGVHTSTDEEFEQSLKIVESFEKKKKRKRIKSI